MHGRILPAPALLRDLFDEEHFLVFVVLALHEAALDLDGVRRGELRDIDLAHLADLPRRLGIGGPERAVVAVLAGHFAGELDGLAVAVHHFAALAMMFVRSKRERGENDGESESELLHDPGSLLRPAHS